ncbi:MAG: MOSC domain-containing protein [Anaerolineae bacterium]
MSKQYLGTIKELFRYPVKSMGGERVGALELGEFGAAGDRAYALREKDGRITTAKRTTSLLEFRAKTIASGEVEISLPDGSVVHTSQDDASQKLSAFLKREVNLERWQTDQQNYGELDAKTIFADVPIQQALAGKKRQLPNDADRYDLATGTFFDSAHLHLLSTGTLAHLKSLIGSDVNVDIRRFRPNILIDTIAELSGFIEDDWVDKKIIIGDSVEITEIWPTLRCVMTTVQQNDLPKDIRILHTVVKQHETHLGAFAKTGIAGQVKVGDPVYLV